MILHCVGALAVVSSILHAPVTFRKAAIEMLVDKL
jgi:hypothetical protein